MIPLIVLFAILFAIGFELSVDSKENREEDDTDQLPTTEVMGL